jgi:hypothetical protein
MPQTDILNPTQGWDTSLGDSMNPDYGFTRKRPSTQLRKKAVGGTPWTRETQNSGHVFQLSWIGRTWACAQRLRQYYEQYEDGFFTIIDWDGGGRHYVGRFTGEDFPIVETSNNKWDVQNLTFEEIPIVPMVQYPSDWTHDAVMLFPWNDFGDQKLATSGTWSQATLAAEPVGITLGGIARTALPLTYMTDPGIANDWAQFEYRGYGFQLYLVQGPAQGQAQVLLDGVVVGTPDCYAAASGVLMVNIQQSVSLDIHRVQVVCLGTKNASSSATNIGWYSLEVMR